MKIIIGLLPATLLLAFLMPFKSVDAQPPPSKTKITWKKTVIDTIFRSEGVGVADINKDGTPDFVTGKRFWAHGPTGDVNPADPAVIYWYELKLNKGQVTWLRHEVDNDSGVGTQFLVTDIYRDGLPDIVTSNKKGVYVFLQQRKGHK